MGKLLLLVTLLMFTACGTPETPATETPEAMETITFDWLIGNWQRSDDKPGRQTFERWKRSTNVLYSGFGHTMEGRDTVWQEDMRLYKKGMTWTLEVSGEGEKVPFKVEAVTPTSFTSTNPKHDFPKVISYDLRGDSLYAVISGDGMEVPFTFGRKE